MYNLKPVQERELKTILSSLSEQTRQRLQSLIATVYNEGYNKGLRSTKHPVKIRR